MYTGASGLTVDNVVVTHQGPPLATFVTTTRALFTGKRDRLWGIFPPAGIPEGAEGPLGGAQQPLGERPGHSSPADAVFVNLKGNRLTPRDARGGGHPAGHTRG